MADKDAERENDGPAMISIWRINMIDFFNNNHNKYLILGHRILWKSKATLNNLYLFIFLALNSKYV
jgi:hypothetical protein